MAMNGNEGGSAYPPNPDVKSGSCLIAGFQPLTVVHPTYWNAYKTESGATFSIDMVRLKLSFINGKGEWLSTHAQTFDCDSMSAWTSKIRPGGWYELWSFDLGDSSVALGIGFMEPSCKVNMNRGFIEFNPNKVAGDKRFWRLLEKLAPCVSHARLKRFDLAYDLPTSRLDCRLSKDRRMYKSVISNGITEYLGVKNTPGYVKVYDKAAEMHLSGVLTRIELTCDGEWDAGQVVAHWPQVHAWHSDESTRDWVRVVGIMLAEKAERGEKDTGRTHKDAAQMRRDAEREIKELDKRKECLRQEVEEMEVATPSLSEGVRTLWKARSDGSREEGLGSAIEGLRGRISDLSSQIADCNGRAEGIERGLPALRARYRELAERFNDTRSRVEQALGRLREVPNTLSELAQDIARKLGKPLFDPDSLDYQTREVTRVAKALDRDRPHVPQQRGHGAR